MQRIGIKPASIESIAKENPTKGLPKPEQGAELVIGLVTPLGVDGEAVVKMLTKVLDQEVNYSTQPIHLIADLEKSEVIGPMPAAGIERIRTKIEQGNKLRSSLGRNDIFALYAVKAVFERRAAMVGRKVEAPPEELLTIPPSGRTAFVIRSFKRPEEIRKLRRIYGPWVLIISAFTPRNARLAHILEELSEEGSVRGVKQKRTAHPEVAELLERDAREEDDTTFGQDARAAFAEADLFIDLTANPENELRRFVRLIFQDRTSTPTKDEYAMFHARAAGLRSSSPFRQVGSAITDDSGELISAGTNEVPRVHGGYEWDESSMTASTKPDNRDLGQIEGKTLGEVMRKRELIVDTLEHLAKAQDPVVLSVEALELLKQHDPAFIERLRVKELRGSDLANVIEYQRSVHAEMAALLNALAHGSNVRNSTMYSTSFPCHICAKHILAAGIKRLVYIEPYPKSRAQHFYPEAIRVDREGEGKGAVEFDPFIGIGPNLFQHLFEANQDERIRKEDGTIKRWEGGVGALPRVGHDDQILANPQAIRSSELAALKDLYDAEPLEKKAPQADGEGSVAAGANAREEGEPKVSETKPSG
jgi:cytidine deaminase